MTLKEFNTALRELGYNSEITNNEINLSVESKYPFNDNSYTLTVKIKPDKEELKVFAKGRNTFYINPTQNYVNYLHDLIINHWK